jgi:hypothetical protein
MSAKQVSVVMDVSIPKTRRTRGIRGEFRKRAGMAQRVSGRWKRSSRRRKRGK